MLADLDQNGVLEQTEVVGRRLIKLSNETYPQRVAANVDILLSTQNAADWNIHIPTPEIAPSQESLFFPKGTLRRLNDPLFDSDFAALGIEDVKWEWNSEGQPVAWARMWLKPNDMAKIGLLYLQQGEWDAKQIIPSGWAPPPEIISYAVWSKAVASYQVADSCASMS